ncbi:EAL domain-containing protein [Metaplanococcus flavidus]|uniref:EAL domain-containing protein n=1 Tax=Metaplanococcus flavidus TaxID=569883 RepID=A0ABW3LA79_9BACL
MFYESASPFLMILSVVIGIVSSYTALILAERMLDRRRSGQLIWMFSGSLVMGMGIFSMHFIGMMAFHLHSPLTYNPFLLFASLAAAVFASFIAFYILHVISVNKIKVMASGFFIGIGIVATHYIGMLAIIKPVELQFNSFYFVLSILVAMVFSSIALKVFFEIKEGHASASRKAFSAVLLGLAVSLMHYIGMKAVFYLPQVQNETVEGMQPLTLAAIVSITVFIIMSSAAYLAFLDSRTLTIERRLTAKVKESEERFRRLAELSPEPIVVHCDYKIVFINEACLTMVGKADKNELIGKSILDFVPSDLKETVRERNHNLKTGFRALPMEQQILTPAGLTIDVEVTGVGIEFEGKPGIQLVLRDITEHKKTGRELEENRQRYQSLFKNNPDGIYSLDPAGQLMNINHSLEEMLGYSLEEMIAMTFHVVVDSDYLEMANKKFLKALAGTPQNYEILAVHKNGDRIPLKITNMPIIVDEKVTGVYGIAKDISKEKKALALLEENEEKYRSLFDHNLDAVFEIDQAGFFTDANKMTEKLTGYSKDELLTMSFPAFIAKDLERVNGIFSELLDGSPVNFEHVIRNRFGALIEVDINAVPKHKQGQINGVFAIVRDVTEKKEAQKRINELAFTDQLTGLPNRHWFYQHLQKVVKTAQEMQQMIAVLLVDFDDFKGINDLLGHHGGDIFLKKVSARIQSCLSKNATISRLGGDEFIIVLEEGTEAEVRRLAEQILEDMKRPFFLLDQEVVMSLSIGISLQPVCTSDEESLIRQADVAMYSAKKKGKNNYQFFTEELNEKINRKMQLEQELQQALKHEEFQLYYQPQVNLQTEILVGLEALIRWNSPSGLISPSEFIPIAEETGLILPIGEWVVQEACRQMKEWERDGRPQVKVSVNVSARQFHDEDLCWKVKKILEKENVDPRNLEIEITESVLLNIEESSLIINELKKLGLKIAIDDFGAGYSSLNVIKNVEIDTLKIDKSLIDEILSNRRNMFILAAIIDVGKNLNAEVIVEGIETQEQAEALKLFDVFGQGYFYSHPLPAEQLEQVWLKKPIKSR